MDLFLKDFVITPDDLKIMFNIILGLVAGFIIAAGYVVGSKDKKYSKNFAITVILLPAIMTVVIPFIATDLKKAVSLAGIFALVRFRSIPGDSKDILYIFFTLTVGVVMGLNNYALAFVITFIVSIVYVVMQLYWNSGDSQILRITIPEDMNYKGVFDEVFVKYLNKYSIKNIKTSNMGSLFTITYDIKFKNDVDVKAFIDEIRVRNGNLNVVVDNGDMEMSL